MDSIATAEAFFIACETGKGWAGCSAYCHADAGFAAQADAIASITTLADYAEWMKGLLVPVPDGAYHLTGFAYDAARDTVIASAVFTGTNSAAGGLSPPTGKAAQSDYVYVIALEDGRVRHMTKVWNDAWALRQLGWA
ncbi:MAG: polyketide cyclase [Alphaproteobacteria bacterium]|nr:MAG: polyketide cyclase [Alphaproteobacteria bacterium]